MDYIKIFNDMQPGFFDKPSVKNLPEDLIFSELIMDLRNDTPKPPPYACPGNISFGEYHGDIGKVKEAVGKVNKDWIRYYNEKSRIFCASDGDIIVSFCTLTDWGRYDGLHIGGPGCVGTVPEYRRKGIGLETVRRATNILKEENFDISWIHYTDAEHWYEKLGYQTVLKWTGGGRLGGQPGGRPAVCDAD